MDKNAQERKLTLPINTLLMLFLGDVAYAVLPIITIAVLRRALNQPFDDFFLLPEWSFASIVFFGLSIRHTLELKVKYQRDFSDKLFLGPQLLILPLIASVLTLALVELSEGNQLMDKKFLVLLQLALFICGLGALFMVNYSIGIIREQRNVLSKPTHQLEARLVNIERAIEHTKISGKADRGGEEAS